MKIVGGEDYELSRTRNVLSFWSLINWERGQPEAPAPKVEKIPTEKMEITALLSNEKERPL